MPAAGQRLSASTQVESPLLGWQLCAAALVPALMRGVPVLRAHTLPDNARVARILRRRWPDGAPQFADGTLVWDLPLRAENVLGA